VKVKKLLNIEQYSFLYKYWVLESPQAHSLYTRQLKRSSDDSKISGNGLSFNTSIKF